jgi:hypothetical protein
MRSLRILLALAAAALAQSSDAGSAEFVFLRNFQGSRAIGMIGIPAPGEDLSGMGLQPASFSHLQYTRLEIGSRIQMAGVDQGNSVYARPLAGGELAGRLDYQSAGQITGVDEHNQETGRTHRPQEMLLDIAFAEPLGDRLSWGVGLKAVEENLDIDNSQAWGVGVDAGAVFQPASRQLAYSLYVANLGTKLTGSTAAERNFGPMPLTFGLTTRYTPAYPRGLSLFLDVQKPIDNDYMVRLGFEHRLNEYVDLRGGFRTDLPEIQNAFSVWVLRHTDPNDPPLSDQRWALGGTVHAGPFSLTYGFQWWQLLNAVHSITLSWDIDASTNSAPQPDRPGPVQSPVVGPGPANPDPVTPGPVPAQPAPQGPDQPGPEQPGPEQ